MAPLGSISRSAGAPKRRSTSSTVNVAAGTKLSPSSGARDAWCAALTPRRTVVVWIGNPSGRGDSGDTAPYTVEGEIEDLNAVINEAGGSAFVFGHSSGAVLALKTAPQENRRNKMFRSTHASPCTGKPGIV